MSQAKIFNLPLVKSPPRIGKFKILIVIYRPSSVRLAEDVCSLLNSFAGRHSSKTSPFSGEEFRFWARAMSKQEVQQIIFTSQNPFPLE
jgi:hypothetical protein